MKQRTFVLHLLREAGERGVTTSEFIRAGAGVRFGGRIFDLRTLGHVIEGERIRTGAYRYTLTHDAERGTGSPVPGSSLDARASGAEQPDDAPRAGSVDGAPEAAPPTPGLFEAPPTPSARSAALYDYDPEDEAA